MAVLIRLRDPDTGKSEVYDPKEYDISGMLKDGFTRAGDVMIAAHSRAMPTRKQQEKFTPAELQDSGATQPEFVPDPVQEPGWVGQIPTALGGLGGALGFAAGGGADILASIGTGGALAPTIPAAAVGGGVIGAGIGGSVGQGSRLLINKLMGTETPSTPMDVAGSIAGEGGKQMAWQALGEGLSKSAQIGGRTAMKLATRATPEAIQAAIREGITVSEKGVTKLMGRLGDYGNQMRRLAFVSKMKGETIDPLKLVNRTMEGEFGGTGSSLAQKIADNQTGDQPIIKKKTEEYLKQLFERQGGKVMPGPDLTVGDVWFDATPMTPDKVLKLKQDASRIATPIFTALNNREQAHLVTADDKIKAHAYAAVMGAADEYLAATLPELKIGGKLVSYPILNNLESGLIQLKQAIAPDIKSGLSIGENVAKRAIPSAIGAGVGGALGAYGDVGGNRGRSAAAGAALGMTAVNNPQAMSSLALLLSNPQIRALLAQTPRGAAGLMQGNQ